MIIPIESAGEPGLITDIAPHKIPLSAWSAAMNMRFKAGFAERINGYSTVLDSLPISPYFITVVRNATGSNYGVYADANRVYVYDSVDHTEITRASGVYSSAGKYHWQGGVLNGLLYLNNGVDLPQVWATIDKNVPLIDLPNVNASYRAKIFRGYKNFLVALDVTTPTGRDSRLVAWSHATEPGTVPTSWEPTDPAVDAGQYSLADTDGIIVDCLPLRDHNLIYKDDSVWRMSYVGGVDIFGFFNVFNSIGAIAKNCIVEFLKGQHFVLGRDDIYIHDGQTIQTPIRDRMRKSLFNNLDDTNAYKSFVAINAVDTEVWVCFPSIGSTECNTALVWNWKTGAACLRELPNVNSATTWVRNTDLFSYPNSFRLALSSPDVNKVWTVQPEDTQFDGEDFESYLERTCLGIPFNTNSPPDMTSMKMCTNIWPEITGDVGGIVQVRIGTQMDISDDPVWQDWQDFIIGTTKKLDVIATGRLFCLSFKTTTEVYWRLTGYALDVQPMGNY